ncbi:hypothetical protein ACFPL7_22285 [Dongia soli]|uniref:Uncharacterized protein n=1 Tax=Dongia soli TaxID=600628 RepID=A0ABU5E9N8_9PROT|nr:hypothetical protein [Dongia soli]MDY0882320.1 hypothetical protein [Dongia soli]
MTAQLTNLECRQGDSLDLLIEVHQDSETGPALLLTDYSARMQVRKHIADPVPALDLSSAGGGITIDGDAGTITVSISPDQTKTIPVLCDRGIFPIVENYIYDLEIHSPQGAVTTLVMGNFTVFAEVTR